MNVLTMREVTLGLLALALACGCSSEAAKKRHLARGEQFFARGRYAEAIVEYTGALQRDPTNGIAIRQLGLAYLEAGDPGRAYPHLRRAAQLEPERMDLKIRLAQLSLAGGAGEEARRLAEEALEQDPGNLDALLVLADASTTPAWVAESLALLTAERDRHADQPKYFLAVGALQLRHGDLEAAGASIGEAVRLAPSWPDGFLARGQWNWLGGDTDAARADFLRAYELAPTSSVAGIRWAAFNRSTGNLDAARKVLEDMLAASPTFVPALFERASLDAAEQRFDEALEGLQHVLALNPDHVPSLLSRSRIHLLRGELDEASREVEAVVRKYPGAAAARVEMARILVRQGKVAQAEQELQAALALAPGYGEAALALAELEIRAGRHAAAVAHAAPFAEPGSPIRASALLLLGAAHRLKGDWNEALEDYRELARLMPRSPEPAFLTALTHQAAKRPQESAAAFQQALDLRPAYVPALAGLVGLDLQAGRAGDALRRVDQQLQREPGVAGFHYLRASIVGQQGDLAATEAALLKTVELDPDFAPAYRDLGRLYVRQGRMADAVARLDAAIAAHPQDAASLLMLGVLHQQEGRVEEAISVYERVLQVAPRSPGALNNLAYLLATSGRDLDRALECAQRARDLAPTDPAIADTLGLVALKRKDYRWALGLLEESALQLGNEPEVLNHLALARHALGQEDAARAALSRALASERDFPGRDAARRLLAVLEIPLAEVKADDAPMLERALETDAENPSVLIRLAALLEQEGKVPEAITKAERALAAQPQFLPALVTLVRLYRDQPERALAMGRRARELAPRDAGVAAALGWAAFQAGDAPWGRSLLLEAAQAQPDDGAIQIHLAHASLMVGRLADSRRAALRAREVLAANKEVETFLRLLDAYEGRLDAAGAAAALADGRAISSLSALTRLAQSRLASGAESEERYAELRAAYPVWPLPARDWAALRTERGEVGEATMRAAAQAAEQMPEDGWAARVHGVALAQRGSWDAALPWLRKADASQAGDATALYWLARASAETGQGDAASSTMSRALAAGLPASLGESARQLLDAWSQKKKP